MMSSHICFVLPYGEVASRRGVCSLTGSFSAWPYTVQDDENTRFLTPVTRISCRMFISETRLFW